MKKPTRAKPAKKPAKRCTTQHRVTNITLVNNKGSVMHLRGSMTLGELIRAGAILSIVPAGTPLADGEWKDTRAADTTLCPKLQ